MEKLTYGERVVRCLLGEEIDYVPYGTFLGWAPWPETLDMWRKESGIPDLEVYKYFNFDPTFDGIAYTMGMCPPFEEKILEEDDTYKTWIDYRGIVTRNLRYNGSIPEYLSYPVKTPDDWERIKKERFSKSTVERFAPVNWDEVEWKIKNYGTAIMLGYYPYGMFGAPRDLMGAEELLVALNAAVLPRMTLRSSNLLPALT